MRQTSGVPTTAEPILSTARSQVLEEGRGLSEAQVLEVLQLPDDGAARPARARPRGAAALVRARGRGRGHRLGEDRRLPRGLPLLLAVRPVRLAGARRLAGHPVAGAGREGDRRHRRHRVLHRRRGARPGRAADDPDARRRRRDPRGGRHQRRRIARHAQPGAGRRPRRHGRAPLQPQPRDRPVVLPAGRHDAHLGGALVDADDGPRGRHGGLLRRHRRHGRVAGAARRARRRSWPS